jgi:riboflavin kinase / FMN adenylyltransferase
VNVARSASELERLDRAVAIGTFDGVHLGHRRVIESVVETGLVPTVVTFEPHPRLALGYDVELLSTLDRRLELLAAEGVEDTLVVEFTPDFAFTEAEAFAVEILRPIGTRVVVGSENFRFGHKRLGDLELLDRLGFEVRNAPYLEGMSSTTIRDLLHSGDVEAAARLLGRPPEVEGTVVAGDARGGTLGFPTANLAVPAHLLVPAFGIYAGSALGKRAAVSIGTNPHYGGRERRVEAFLLDFEGNLYGRRLVLELWRHLRDEQMFESEKALIDQIARDVEAAGQAERPG